MAGDADTLDRDDELQAGAEEGDEQQDGQQADDGAQAADDAAGDTEGGATDEAGDGAESGDGEAAANDADAELVVTIGDEPAADFEDDDIGDVRGLSREQLAAFVRMRQQKRDAKRRARELEAKLAGGGQPAAAQQPLTIGDMPKIDDDGIDYDPEKHAAAVAAWTERKLAVEQQRRAQQQAAEQAQQQWQAKLASVTQAAASMKVSDADDAIAAFEDTFSVMQQAIIIDAPSDPKTAALLRYALGKNPKAARQLAAITNPVQFTWALKELADKVKTTPRKTAPPPDQRVRSPGAGAGIVQQGRLNQLHAEAQRTGDYTQYLAAKRVARKAA